MLERIGGVMDRSDRLTVAIIGAGEMGSAVGRRLHDSGVRVMTELKARSDLSVRRVTEAGLEIINDDQRLAREADFMLSIVPPGVACEVAERFREPMHRSNRKPVFVECNAIAPDTVRQIQTLLVQTGCAFVDAGIVGGPPPPDDLSRGPRFYASGPDAARFAQLSRYGLDIAELDGRVGTASALKLCYAGLTKGFTALGAAMIGAAARDGLADALREELARTQPDMLARLDRFVPAMFPKAYRWVAEMEQIAEFLGGDAGHIYQGAAQLYQQLAAEVEHGESGERLSALARFCRKT
jgi:3-hydroxyisobutyrate dehydrogenase-like beta-hydroxyacid dehydrogenase